jgi:hypothetical protein
MARLRARVALPGRTLFLEGTQETPKIASVVAIISGGIPSLSDTRSLPAAVLRVASTLGADKGPRSAAIES